MSVVSVDRAMILSKGKPSGIGEISTDINTSTVYVDGAIFNNNNQQPIYGATLRYLTNDGMSVGDPVTLNEGSNSFTVWTYRPDEILVKFSKHGFDDVVIPFSILQDNSNVMMSPGTSNVMLPVLLIGAGLFLMPKGKKKVGKIEAKEVMPWLFVAGGAYLLITGVDVLKGLLDKLGLTKGKGTKEAEQESADPNSSFKPDYWKNYIGKFTYTIDKATAQSYAKTIHGAFTLFYDDYETIFGVFSRMKTKANVSYLADIFQQQYGEDLLSFLRTGGGILPWDGLSETHLQTIIDFVNNLKAY